jgi:hypothetical protein
MTQSFAKVLLAGLLAIGLAACSEQGHDDSTTAVDKIAPNTGNETLETLDANPNSGLMEAKLDKTYYVYASQVRAFNSRN